MGFVSQTILIFLPDIFTDWFSNSPEAGEPSFRKTFVILKRFCLNLSFIQSVSGSNASLSMMSSTNPSC